MIRDFIRGIFGKSKREELYKLSEEEMNTVKDIIERRTEEEKQERITRIMKTDSVKSDPSGFWTVDVEYKETRIDPAGEKDVASVGAKSICRNLDTGITDAWFTVSNILAPFGGDLFKFRASKER